MPDITQDFWRLRYSGYYDDGIIVTGKFPFVNEIVIKKCVFYFFSRISMVDGSRYSAG
jgi:hypothetical protein